MFDPSMLEAIRRHGLALADGAHDSVVDAIDGAHIALLGEATHGSREFYRARALVTQRLIQEQGFDAVAVEADWPDALRASRYARGEGRDPDSQSALGDFRRFPRWMWRNPEVRAFIGWLRRHNGRGGEPVGFYGLDLYSLRASMDAVLHYLADVDPEAEARARQRYACFDHFGEDPQQYGYAAHFGLSRSCENAVVQQMLELSRQAHEALAAGTAGDGDELFYARQNARVARNAEAHYRGMFAGRHTAWNLRDTHMVETLEALRAHLSEARGRPARIVVWAHNSHIGDARATEMGEQGEVSLGQLARERFGPENVVSVGFTTHAGTVTAARDWGGSAGVRTVLPSLPDSYERLFHDAGLGNFALTGSALARIFGRTRRLQRAIGVIYRPETERLSHYFHSRIADQFDALVHIDETTALRPLDGAGACPAEDGEPETYPSGL